CDEPVPCRGLIRFPRTHGRSKRAAENKGVSGNRLSLPIRLTHTPTSDSELISVAGARPRFAELVGTLFQSGDTGMNAPAPIVMDVNQHAALPFPRSLPEFQRLFPDDMAC